MEKRLPNNWSETKFTNLISFIIGGDWGYDSEKVIEDSSLVYCIRGGEIRDWNKNKGNTAALRRLKNTSIETLSTTSFYIQQYVLIFSD